MKTLLLLCVVLGAAACGDGAAHPIDAGQVDAPAGPDAAPGPDASCFEDPQTYTQIINACTDATKIDKRPVLPLQNPDGSLPPLP